ncbi:MAG: hypothetical protein GY801_03215 [bacterium]|nr:hypothetical protein [bacterium]
MNTQEMNQYIRTMYREWGQGNCQPFFDVLSEDVVVTFPVSTRLPWAGTHHGKERLKNIFSQTLEYGEYTAFDLIDVISSEKTHVVLMSESFRVKASGETIDLEQVFVYKVENDLVAEIREFTDTAVIRDAFST